MEDLATFIKDEFDATWNTGDAEAVIARFGEDAVVRTQPPLPGAPEAFRGRAEIRDFVRMLIPNFRVESRDFRQDGDRVTWYATVSSDSIRAMGVDALSADCEATVRDRHVDAFTVRFTPETLARLEAAGAGRASQGNKAGVGGI